MSSKWLLSFKFSDQNFVCVSLLSRHAADPAHLVHFDFGLSSVRSTNYEASHYAVSYSLLSLWGMSVICALLIRREKYLLKMAARIFCWCKLKSEVFIDVEPMTCEERNWFIGVCNTRKLLGHLHTVIKSALCGCQVCTSICLWPSVRT
jgi:hypothetical protein